MVVFNCNACGEALKKNQVEKHYQIQCRKCEVLSCVDCGKEFWGTDYETHTKCISEEEKYSGKNFKPRPGANKGEQKQELWTSQVQAAVSKVSANNTRLKGLLVQLTDYPNIPRKKAKFENFLKNSFRVFDARLASEAWDAISTELNKLAPAVNGSAVGEVKQANEKTTAAGDKIKTKALEAEGDWREGERSEEGDKKQKYKDKKSKKENGNCRRLEQVREEDVGVEKCKINGGHSKKEKGSLVTTGAQCGEGSSEEGVIMMRKKRKKKESEGGVENAGDIEQSEEVTGEQRKKKKRKNNKETDSNTPTEELSDNVNDTLKNGDSNPFISPSPEHGDVSPIVGARGAFNWNAAIIDILCRAPDKQMKIKKLRKKVLGEFNARGGDGKVYTEETILSTFTRKLKKNTKVKLNQEIAQLLS